MNNISTRRILVPTLLVLAVAATRLPTLERLISGLDPGSYLLAMHDFSIEQMRPHPPGYPVWVAICRLAWTVTPSDHAAFLLVVVLFSMAAVWLLYRLAVRLADDGVAFTAALLLLTNPLFWLYGTTSENYSWDAFFSTASILAMLVARGPWWGVVGVGLGLALGVRTTSVGLLTPVYLYLLWKRKRVGGITWGQFALMAAGSIAGVAAWLPATIVAEGGIDRFVHAATALSMTAAGPFFGNIVGVIATAVWTLNIAMLYLVARSRTLVRGIFDSRRGELATILLVWIVPPALFFLFVIHTKGYSLLILPGICLLIARLVHREPSGRRNVIRVILVAANLAIFLAVPYSDPPEFTSLAPRNRTAVERLQSFLGRMTSAYLPSLSRIRSFDEQTAEALALTQRVVADGADTTLVILDPPGRIHITARVLQYYDRRLYLCEPGTGDSTEVVYVHGISRSEVDVPIDGLVAPRMLVVTGRDFAGRWAPVGGRVLERGEHIAIVEIPRDRAVEFRKLFLEMFHRPYR